MKLFLQGVPGCGKSTAILKAIETHRELATGYMTSRIFSSDGIHRGFALFPASDRVPLELVCDEVLPSQFFEFNGEGKCVFHRDVLENNILKYIRYAEDDLKNRKKSFAVLDEIGGYELNNAKVFAALKDLLYSDYPCIGVIKEAEHARDLLDGGRIMDPCYEKYLELIEFMNSREDILIAEVNGHNMWKNVREWAESLI